MISNILSALHTNNWLICGFYKQHYCADNQIELKNVNNYQQVIFEERNCFYDSLEDNKHWTSNRALKNRQEKNKSFSWNELSLNSPILTKLLEFKR